MKQPLPQFFDSLINLVESKVLVGEFREAQRLLQFGLTVGDEATDADDHLRLKIHCSDLLWKFGDIDAAEALLTDVTHSDPLHEAHRLYNLGEIYYVRHFLMLDESVSVARVLDTHREAYEIRRSLDAEKPLVISMSRLGTIYERIDDFVEAHNLYQRALKLAGPLDFKRGMTRPLIHLGVAERKKHNWEEATNYFQKALTYSQDIRFAEGMAFAHFNLGQTLFGINEDGDVAMQHYRQGLELARKMDFVLASIRGTMLVASLQRLLSQGKKAHQLWDMAYQTAEKVGYQSFMTSIDDVRGPKLS